MTRPDPHATAGDGAGLREDERDDLCDAVMAYSVRSEPAPLRFDKHIAPAVERILAARLTAAHDEPGEAASVGDGLAEEVAAAEQRGREDNADHAMCYVHGSKALAARERAVRAEALREAADEFPIGVWSTARVRQLLRDRAALEDGDR